MGGIRDSSTFVGFEYTYSGSRYGMLSQCLMDSEVMNPIIFMDELDKISLTNDGVDIQNLLIHITDPVQNMTYQDKYFSGVTVDLSKVIFVFAFNDVNLINPILKDMCLRIYQSMY
jgi:ATP-dependent Lon protease